MNCNEIVASLHLFLDEELSVENKAVVQQHLSTCLDCERRFLFDLNLKNLIRESFLSIQAPAQLQEAVLRLSGL